MSIFVDIEKTLGNFRLKVAFEAGNETLALLGVVVITIIKLFKDNDF